MTKIECPSRYFSDDENEDQSDMLDAFTQATIFKPVRPGDGLVEQIIRHAQFVNFTLPIVALRIWLVELMRRSSSGVLALSAAIG